MYRFNHPSAPNTRPEQKPEQSRSISWKKALAIGAAVPLLLLFGAAFQSSNSVPGQLQAIQAKLSSLEAKIDSLANKGPRKFYLTKTDTHTGAEALSACAEGYHMASMMEIQDPSNLRYDTDLGFNRPDSGFGPPSSSGWIRTGHLVSNGGVPGNANCSAWTSADLAQGGTFVGFLGLSGWSAAGTTASPWVSGTIPCNSEFRVWCVQD